MIMNNIFLVLLIFVFGCEGDNYSLLGEQYSWSVDSPGYNAGIPYNNDCAEGKVPIAIVSDYERMSGYLGGTEDLDRIWFANDYKNFGGDRWYGIYCLEIGGRGYSFYSSDSYNDYDFQIIRLDANNDGEIFLFSEDNIVLEQRNCDGNYSSNCPEPITGSIALE
jgi:hypothetical protein